jgi:23S rRNA-/tRNA-specific pseudouridylate synthase
MPILGDRVYGPQGTRRRPSAPRTMLHAQRLAFRHPISGELIVAESPLPSDFGGLIDRLSERRGNRARRA